MRAPHPPVWRLLLLGCVACFLVATSAIAANELSNSPEKPETSLTVLRAWGDLEITNPYNDGRYQAYFSIPIATRFQVPVLIEVEGPQLLDYRFVRIEPPNVICAARLLQSVSTDLNWKIYVLVEEETWSDMPTDIPTSTLAVLPDSVLPWLARTDCCQTECGVVRNKANTVTDGMTNVVEMADAISRFATSIPYGFAHSPWAFDAFYTLHWGNSCTGHAHAAAALCRSLGIPARVLLNIPAWYDDWMDMHWMIEYYLPTYGWVLLEPTIDQHPENPTGTVMMHACYPYDEFPLFYTNGIETRWFTTDSVTGGTSVNWGLSHRSEHLVTVDASDDDAALARALADSAFTKLVMAHDTNLTTDQQSLLTDALAYQSSATRRLVGGYLADFITNMQAALECYRQIELEPEEEIYFDDFESGVGDWTHFGNHDEWELGAPTFGPDSACSGENCWGTDLDGEYVNHVMCKLVSPVIDLTDYDTAYLDFRVFMATEENLQTGIHDRLYVELGSGIEWHIVSGPMVGKNDDPAVPSLGGWNRMVLDLTPYVGEPVQLRFVFHANSSIVEAGAYLDDVRLYGRPVPETTRIHTSDPPPEPAPDGDQFVTGLQTVSPNPFNPLTTVTFSLDRPQPVRVAVYDLTGRRVAVIVDEVGTTGRHTITWDGRDETGTTMASGAYLVRFRVPGRAESCKIMLMR